MDARERFWNEAGGDLLCAAAKAGNGLYARAYMCSAHLRPSSRHRDILFGCQPVGTVQMHGPKGSLSLSVSDGDFERTTVELSYSEALRLGIKRLPLAGGTQRGADCVLHGPDGKVTLEGGVYAPPRRLHIPADCAAVYGFTDGQRIWARAESADRSLTFGNVIIHIGGADSPTLYLDSDEAFAAGLTDGQLVQLLKEGL